jgi:hypothetical protein
MVVLRPFFSYLGSKWRLSRYYDSPRFDRIIEPFAGSAGYSLRYHDREVYLSDKDPVIAGIWKWLIEAATEDDLLSLPILEKGDYLPAFTDIPEPARNLMGFWIHQGSFSPADSMSGFGAGSNGTKRNYCEVYIERCAAQLQYIRHWKIANLPYGELHNSKATWFVDPPYTSKGYKYIFGSEGINYHHLSRWCTGRNGQVIVCENLGANWLPFRRFREINGNTMPNGSGGSNLRSIEAVWSNS